MKVTETNVTRLLLALYLYREDHAGYAPVDSATMHSAMQQAHIALSERGHDQQSRINRLFSDDLPARIAPLMKLASALDDDNVNLALAYLDGNAWGN